MKKLTTNAKVGIGIIAVILIILAVNYDATPKNAIINTYQGTKITIFKSQSCGCCGGFIAEIQRQGFDVSVEEMSNINDIKEKHKIPETMTSCHTSEIEGYFVEGHMPIEAIIKLLDERPDIDGIALPGMPPGVPGMAGVKNQEWIVYSIKDGKSEVFMRI